MKKIRDSEEMSLEDMFIAYCKMDLISDTKNLELLPLTQCDEWFREAKLLDMRTITTTDTGLCFFKFRKRAINYLEFLKFLNDLAKWKKLNIEDIKFKLQYCTKPVNPREIKKKK